MHGAGREHGRAHADHRMPALAPTIVAPLFAPCAPSFDVVRSCGAGPSQLNKQLNQLLVNAKDARELLCVHATHGRSFDSVNLATCWSLGKNNLRS
jgi:hypothetical protein